MSTQKINELAMADLTATSASPEPQADSSVVAYDDDAGTMAIGNPEPAPAADQRISIYPGSITAVSYSDSDDVAVFDIVFSVGIAGADFSNSKTYQIVKRIGIDKKKIAAEACTSSPVSVVEGKAQITEAKVEPTSVEKHIISEAYRMRRLAGLE